LRDNYRLAVAQHIFKTASEDWRSALAAWLFTMDTTGDLGRGDKRLLSYSARLLKTTFRHWLEDKAPQLGAALAYYTVFSLAPMVLVLLAVFGLIYGNSEVARREILHQLYSFLDRSSAKAGSEEMSFWCDCHAARN
jgi:Virulence factor BrkB